MMFKNRNEAAEKLAEKLKQYSGSGTVVLGIPRGAVPMAEIISRKLDAEMDVILTRKLSAPQHPELAVGAVSENGEVFLNSWAELEGITLEKMKPIIEREMALIRKRRKIYTSGSPSLPLYGKTVILVDDGIATGATMLASIRAVRKQQPRKIVVATGVMPLDQRKRFKDAVDELLVLDLSPFFYSVGQFYDDFQPVTDEEVVRILARSMLSKDKRKSTQRSHHGNQ